jgi:hypothetical protein
VLAAEVSLIINRKHEDNVKLKISNTSRSTGEVYDDQESRCALCTCRDHRLRSSAAREQGSPFPAGHRGQAGAS